MNMQEISPQIPIRPPRAQIQGRLSDLDLV